MEQNGGGNGKKKWKKKKWKKNWSILANVTVRTAPDRGGGGGGGDLVQNSPN